MLKRLGRAGDSDGEAEGGSTVGGRWAGCATVREQSAGEEHERRGRRTAGVGLLGPPFLTVFSESRPQSPRKPPTFPLRSPPRRIRSAHLQLTAWRAYLLCMGILNTHYFC